MKISIPKPCHEDWNAMLPEEKGRFCLKCTKTVVDFSNQSKDQIKSFFKESTGKVCGRFSLNQVESPKVSTLAVFKKRMAKFAIALYLVFGGFLFSCGNARSGYIQGDVAQEDQVLQGKVVVQDTTKTEKPKVDQVKKKTAKGSKAVKSSKKSFDTSQTSQGSVIVIDTVRIEKTMGEVIIEN